MVMKEILELGTCLCFIDIFELAVLCKRLMDVIADDLFREHRVLLIPSHTHHTHIDR